MNNRQIRTVYITGGSSGIGLACARRYARDGADVILIARNEERLSAAVNRVKAEREGGIGLTAGVPLDVTDRDRCDAVFPELVRQYGAPDLLIACAGLAWPEYFLDVSREHFNEQVSVNLEGAWNAIQCLVPFMKDRGGTVVTVSSVAGFIGTFGYSAYSATKFALIGLSESLRNELKPDGIRVAVLCPPDTDTPGFARENEHKPYETKVMSSNIRVVQPENVADALVKGLERGDFMIIPGAESRFSWIMKRLFPSLVFAIIDGDVKKARKTLGAGRRETLNR